MTVWDWLKKLMQKLNKMRSFRPHKKSSKEEEFLKFVQPGDSESNILMYGVVPGFWGWIRSEVFHIFEKCCFFPFILRRQDKQRISFFFGHVRLTDSLQ